MSTQTSAVLCLGTPFKDLSDEFKDKLSCNFGEIVSNKAAIRIFHPYADCDLEDCVVGIEFAMTDSFTEAVMPEKEHLDKLSKVFYNESGISPKMILTLEDRKSTRLNSSHHG